MGGWLNIWEILGIASTTDIREIKRAYAQRAKECHPEEHPEEFQKLQEAYKGALWLAKNKNTSLQRDEGIPERIPDLPGTDAIPVELSVQEEPERLYSSYDFSEIRMEEKRQWEQLKKQKIVYMIWNPYVRNHVQLWSYFFRVEKMEVLLENPEYRADFVHLIYQERFAGWHQDQIQFFHDYLSGFQGKDLSSRELESEEWRWLIKYAGDTPNLLTSPCITPEERQNYYCINIHDKVLLNVLHGEPGQSREERYLVWYLDYAAKNELRLSELYQKWVSDREKLFANRDRDIFQKRLRYMIWNPFVRNNVEMWKCFLHLEGMRELFQDPVFREEFKHRIWQERFAGWHQDQIAFFQKFLAGFSSDSSNPDEFKTKEWNWLKSHAGKDTELIVSPCRTLEEKSNYYEIYNPDLLKSLYMEPGRTQEEQYLNWYWAYAGGHGARLAGLYKNWISDRKRRFYRRKYLPILLAVAALVLAGLWKLYYYRPYDSDLKKYQKMYEQFRGKEGEQEQFQEEFDQLLQEYERQ